MIVRDTSPKAFEFACMSKACAPPPVGKGGSGGGGKGGAGGRSGAPVKPNPLGPGARRNKAQGSIDSTLATAEGRRVKKGGGTGTGGRPAGSGGSIKGVGTGTVKASDLKPGDKVQYAQAKRVVSAVGNAKGRVAVSFKDGGVTDMKPSQSLPRASKKVRVPAGSEAGKMRKYDKKYRMNPNNPANHMRHPDADRPVAGKIVRP